MMYYYSPVMKGGEGGWCFGFLCPNSRIVWPILTDLQNMSISTVFQRKGIMRKHTMAVN